jgi:hypothetical protein
MEQLAACVSVGQKVKIGWQTWTVAKLGKEIRLERQGGRQVLYRHSRTLERMLGAAS